VWFLYVLECSDGSFYTGISNDLEKRIKEHNSGKGSKYARARLPVQLIYSEKIETKSQALKREIEVKRLTRIQKEQLVGKNNDQRRIA
jgi:putative endonuclease